MGVSLPNIDSVSDGAAVITTSGGNIYVFGLTFPGSNLAIYKSTNNGSSFSSLTSVTCTTIHGGSTYYITGLDAVIDGSGIIHVLCQTDLSAATRDVAYCTFDTSNDTWGTWTEVTSTPYDTGGSRQCSIAIDSSDKLHILYTNVTRSKGTNYTNICYKNNVSGSWSTEEVVSTGTNTYNYWSPVILVRNSDIVEALYYRASDSVVFYRTRTSGSWGSESSLTNSSGDAHSSLISTTGGTVYRYTKTATPNEDLYENDSLIISDVNYYGANYQNNIRYLVYTEFTGIGDGYVHLQKNSGSGWGGDEVLEASGPCYGIVTEWSYNREYQNGRINYLYDYNNNNIYFGYKQLSANVTTSKSAYMYGAYAGRTNKSAFINGVGNADPAVTYLALYIASVGSGASVNSNKAAFIKGKSSTSSNKSAYVFGKLGAITNKAAFILGISNPMVAISDVATSGTWKNQVGGTSNLYQSIDETTINDTDFIICETPTAGNYYECNLTKLTNVPKSGDIVVFIRARDTTGSNGKITVQFRQDSTIISSSVRTLTSTAYVHYFTLSAAERQNVTDWTKLRVRVIIGEV